MLKRLLPLLLFLIAWPVSAQDGGEAFISRIDTSNFPEITATVFVSDADGMHVGGLTASAFTVTEDDHPVADLRVREEAVGVQVVFVLNSGGSFRPRDANGKTRLDYVKDGLLLWTEADSGMEDGLDDVSVITPEGALLTHASSGRELRDAVLGYESTYAGAESGLQLLQQGLDFVLDPSPRPGMQRALILISSALDDVLEIQVEDLAARARDARVSLSTFYVGPAGSEQIEGAQNVARVAQAAGGQHFFFDAPEVLLPVYQEVAGRRSQYALTFRSRAAGSGNHRLAVRVQAGPTALSSELAEFLVSVQSASIRFLNLPSEVTHSTGSAVPEGAQARQPAASIQIAIEFPDGQPRELARTVLLVDDQPVAENTSPPFDRFDWDVKRLTTPGEHRLRAVVVDELGIQSQSEQAVLVVRVPEAPIIERIVPSGEAPAIVPIAAGAAGVLVVAIGGWIYWRRRRLDRPSVPPKERSQPKPALRPPIAGWQVPRGKKPKPAPSARKLGRAYLEFVDGGQSPIEVREALIRLGRDSTVAQAVFADRSVSRLHARLAEVSEGVFYLYDEGSTSGTWVNYEPVPIAGLQLHDGDLINLGRVQLRFHVRTAGAPAAAPAPTATPAPREDIPTGPTVPVRPVPPELPKNLE